MGSQQLDCFLLYKLVDFGSHFVKHVIVPSGLNNCWRRILLRKLFTCCSCNTSFLHLNYKKNGFIQKELSLLETTFHMNLASGLYKYTGAMILCFLHSPNFPLLGRFS